MRGEERRGPEHRRLRQIRLVASHRQKIRPVAERIEAAKRDRLGRVRAKQLPPGAERVIHSRHYLVFIIGLHR